MNNCDLFTKSNNLPVRMANENEQFDEKNFFQNKESWNFGQITQHFDKVDSDTVAP
jgi:hypothetical protein